MERGRDIIPSTFSIGATPSYYDGELLDDVRLRVGEVQEILQPDDKKNKSQQFTEYNVYVQYKSNGTSTGVMYFNCLLANPFGGLADQLHYTLRVPSTPSQKQKDSSKFALGSKVLMLCINGERPRTYILSGIRDPQDTSDKDTAKESGHHLYAIFNGMSFNVDKDGQFTITYGGKTEIDGKKSDSVDDKTPGTTLKFLKNGSFSVSDKDDKNQLLIDHENSKVVVKRDSAFELGDATDKMLLGESFRNSQKQMNNKLKSYLDTANNLVQQAGTQLQSAGGSIIGPFMSAAAGRQMTAAGALLLSAAQMLKQMGEAINQFESDASAKNSFISKKNSAD